MELLGFSPAAVSPPPRPLPRAARGGRRIYSDRVRKGPKGVHRSNFANQRKRSDSQLGSRLTVAFVIEPHEESPITRRAAEFAPSAPRISHAGGEADLCGPGWRRRLAESCATLPMR